MLCHYAVYQAGCSIPFQIFGHPSSTWAFLVAKSSLIWVSPSSRWAAFMVREQFLILNQICPRSCNSTLQSHMRTSWVRRGLWALEDRDPCMLLSLLSSKANILWFLQPLLTHFFYILIHGFRTSLWIFNASCKVQCQELNTILWAVVKLL